ncbi:MAG: UDP-N-acetylglucosamine--N-acetylmuramyl-(pentapeptide) pyrophosphoryl-undecaprenol N-acetylglucosamine transferase, partial [Planctomycetes bacterium]|nr:UDP-N-acetylglucosamine--N-acetylmuramyl-(pentapeptide) pyrophosphoryl-undecaprenol N-acetylglucosamine transferase [Planctomycetota bacterium]
VSAARTWNIRILLTKLDHPPGKANRWMARLCVDVVTAIELPDFPNFATSIVGMPVRRRALAPASGNESGQVQACRSQLGLEPDRQTLLVTGASQGSTSINEFIVAMAEREPDVFEGWQILHLAGTEAGEDLEQRYETTGVPAQVRPFLHDIGLAWGAADLALSRAGASSVAEAACNSVPTIFLPYPYHRDMHQKFNARRMVEMGGALLETDAIEVEANLKRIGPRLRELMTNPLKLLAMRSVLRSNVPPDAALIVARMLIEKSC